MLYSVTVLITYVRFIEYRVLSLRVIIVERELLAVISCHCCAQIDQNAEARCRGSVSYTNVNMK